MAYGGQPLPFGGGANREATSWLGTIDGKGVRGFDTREYLRNGFLRYSDNGSATIDRIEVIKGPTSVLDGVTSPGGVINVITKKPIPNYDFTRLNFVFGSPFDRIVANFDFNKRLTPNRAEGLKATLRLVGGYEESGYLTEHRNRRLENVMPSLLLEFTPHTLLGIQHEHYKVNGERGNDIRALRTTVTEEHPSGLDGEVPIHFAYGVPQNMSWDGPDINTPEVAKDTLISFQHQFSDDVVFNIDYNSHSRVSNWGPVTFTGSVVEIDEAPYWQQSWRETERDQSVTGLRINLASKLSLKQSEHRFVFGFLGQEDINNWQSQNYLNEEGEIIQQRFSLFDPNPALFAPIPSRLELSPNKRDDTFTQSLYLNHHAKWLDGALITLWGVYDTRLDSETERVNRGEGFAIAPNSEYQSHKTMPQAGIIYSPIQDLGIYINYSQSMQGNAGRFDGWGNSFPETPGEIREIGSKFTLADGKVSGTVSLFEIKETNRVVFDWFAPNRENPTADPNLRRGANVSFGALESQGIDADIHLTPNKNINAVFSYGYKDIEITSDPDISRIGQSTDSYKHKVSLFGKHIWSDGALGGLSANAGLIWKSKRQREADRFGAPSYAKDQYKLQAGFNYSFSFGEINYKLGFTAKNVGKLSKRYYGYVPGTREPYYFDSPSEYLLSFDLEY
ncbi:TonB-dependent siderophore receptor [Pelagicoccus mobilis]|nr:TonB-dependent receptor [Pelagicoccus mobilis]